MFYSQFILAKKGPLGTIWIAAHLERKLRKNQVTETNISVSVDSILFPEVPIALRLSGHLLLGVVRIYSRKVNYLFHDCSEALVKIKQAFHAGAVDLPPEAATAPFHSITLPETFDLDEFEPLLDKELNALHANGAVDHHITSREQITLQDPLEDSNYLGSSQFELDERFPDGDAPQLEIDFDEDLLDKAGGAGSHAASPLNEEEDMPLEEDVLPPSRMDEELDYDQMDRMEVMDIDDHPEPVTPGLGLDNMDLDYQRDPDDEQLDAGQDDMERLEPTFAMDNDDLGPADIGAERLAPEATTPGSPENEVLEYQREAGLDLDLEASVDPHGLEEGEGVVHHVEETVATPGEEEARRADEGQALEHELEENFGQMEEKRDEVVERTAEEGVAVGEEGVAVDVLPDEKTLDEEGETGLKETAGGDDEGLFGIRGDQEGPDDVPDYEKVMSAPEETNQDQDVFDLEAGLDMEPASDALPYENEQPAEEGAPYMQEEGGQPADMADPMSPMRSPPVPVISSEDLPGDDDLLASLPGRRISGLTLVPTPSDNAATKARRRQGQRKRKIVIDMGTILGADIMKQQLENTDDIRRVRRKAPCTRQELWSVHKESLNQLFCEHSVPGLCGELRILFERVYVVGEANLPQAEPVEPEIVPGEELPESQQQEHAQEQLQEQFPEQFQEQEQEQHPVMEDLNADVTVEMHPDDMKEMENEIPGSPVIQEEAVPAEDAPIDQQQAEVAGAAPSSLLETPERVSSPLDTLPAKFEEAENVQIQTPVSRHEDQATLGSPKEELPNVLDTEVVNPVDLNSASLEMEEAMETLREQEALETDVQEAAAGPISSSTIEEMQFLGRVETPDVTAAARDFHPMIDVNVTNPEDEGDAFEGNLPKAMNAPDLGAYGTPAHAPPATADLDTEFPSSNVPFSEAETEPYVQDSVVEETQRIGPEGEFEYVEGMHGVGPSSEFDTQILPAEERFRQEPPESAAGAPMEQEGAFTTTYRDDKAEPYDIERQAAAFESTPAQARPEEEDLEFLADARDTEFLGADDDDLMEEPEDFQELNDYSTRKEAVTQDNSGWSARTRAVGHFLRITLEDKDAYMQRRGEQGVAKLGLERVLVGKSRKEAARMFFETLVLKTKDYIHVDQDQPYGDIQISSRPKLMKAKF